MAQLAKLASIGGRGAASIVDQASAAAIGFVCSVFVGRFLGAESLGIYAIASVFVLFIVAVQAAIILDPMSVFGAKKPGEEMPRYYGFLVGLEVSVVSLFIVFLALGSLLAYVLGFVERTLFLVLGAAAIYANFLCFHYFLRRQFYLEHRQHLATVQSIAYLALVAAGFSALWWLGGSTVPRVYIVLSLCSFAICIFQSKLLANKVRRPEAGDVKRYAGEH